MPNYEMNERIINNFQSYTQTASRHGRPTPKF